LLHELVHYCEVKGGRGDLAKKEDVQLVSFDCEWPFWDEFAYYASPKLFTQYPSLVAALQPSVCFLEEHIQDGLGVSIDLRTGNFNPI